VFGLDCILLLAASPFEFSPISSGLWAYGPAPGLEFIPYFLSLLAWVGLAFAAILLSPLTALLRRLRRGKSTSRTEPENEPSPLDTSAERQARSQN